MTLARQELKVKVTSPGRALRMSNWALTDGRNTIFYYHVTSCALARRGARRGATEASGSGDRVQRVWARLRGRSDLDRRSRTVDLVSRRRRRDKRSSRSERAHTVVDSVARRRWRVPSEARWSWSRWRVPGRWWPAAGGQSWTAGLSPSWSRRRSSVRRAPTAIHTHTTDHNRCTTADDDLEWVWRSLLLFETSESSTFRPVVGQRSEVVPFLQLQQQRRGIVCQATLYRSASSLSVFKNRLKT